MNPKEDGGLRERKKIATREALSAAALRLALEHGAQNVHVDDIADAAGVSPRTYNNYFSSREQAIVTAIAAERALRLGAALRARPAGEPLAESVTEAVVAQYGADGLPAGDLLSLITSSPGLRTEFVSTIAAIEQPIAAAIAARVGDAGNAGEGVGHQDGEREGLAAAVLAAAVSAAVRVAIERWLRVDQDVPQQAAAAPGLVIPRGSLTELLREALAQVAPALQAADSRR